MILPSVVILVLLAAITFLGSYQHQKSIRSTIIKDRGLILEGEIKVLQNAILGAADDLNILAQHPALANRLDFSDPVFLSHLDIFLGGHNEFFQFRIIDQNGHEIFRTEHDTETGRLSVTRAEDLQSKADRYYVEQGLQLADGAIYVSRLDYNVEDGTLEMPFRPTVRIVKTIVRDGQSWLLVLNMDISRPLEALWQALTTGEESITDNLLILGTGDSDYDGDGQIDRHVRLLPRSMQLLDPADIVIKDPKVREIATRFSEPRGVINDSGRSIIALKQRLIPASIDESAGTVLGLLILPDALFWSYTIALDFNLLLVLAMGYLLALIPIWRNIANEIRLDDALGQTWEAMSELERKQKREKHLLALIGHELRTPIASARMLLAERPPKDDASNDAILCSTLDHALDVLDDLKRVAQVGTVAEDRMEKASPAEVCATVCASLEDFARQRDFKIRLHRGQEAATTFQIPIQAIRQVLNNLIRNAVVHSRGSLIDVAVEVDSSSRMLNLSVSDDGKGIDAEKHERIFEEFFSESESIEGTGLGLAISRALARANQGDLQVAANDKGGAVFTACFRCLEAGTEAEQEATSTKPEGLEGMTILLVDDDSTIRRLTSHLLEKEGVTVVPAEDGVQALQLFTKHDVDAVITDIMMPNIDGYALTRELRAMGFSKAIIGISAASVGDEFEQLLDAGADMVLPKPITAESLRAALKR